eukprot:GHVR01179921.1.p1 GENE.GHVR01179921.1~~GHVR01179921.1.p1  ORF type:complete len:185 (+),score=99.85 GHVR01179921.1:434-988(+)
MNLLDNNNNNNDNPTFLFIDSLTIWSSFLNNYTHPHFISLLRISLSQLELLCNHKTKRIILVASLQNITKNDTDIHTHTHTNTHTQTHTHTHTHTSDNILEFEFKIKDRNIDINTNICDKHTHNEIACVEKISDMRCMPMGVRLLEPPGGWRYSTAGQWVTALQGHTHTHTHTHYTSTHTIYTY